MKNKAFTLLELLVVITIIGILASIVVVSMSGSTDSATIAKGKVYAQQVHALLGHEAVLDLNFNENIYNTCPDGKDVCDASGHNNNGTIYQDEDGAAFISSHVDGYALDFDGIDDCVDVGNSNSLRINGDGTFEAWIKTTQISGSMCIFDESHAWAVGRNYEFKIINDNLSFWHGDGDTGVYYYSNYPVANGNFRHVVFVADFPGYYFYVDGIQVGTDSMSFPLIEGTGTHHEAANRNVGGMGNWASPFSGLIDEVRIYAEALPATEIQKHYVQGLEKLLSNQAITKAEYDQRMEEFKQSLVLYE